MNNMKAFIYFVEPEVIEGVLSSWPQKMRLALCLYKTGQVEIVMFHCKEGHGIIKRMRDILKLDAGSFGIVPETRGYPTKAIRFSDQQHFLKLIMEKEDLCEIASDYAINYRFAEEEGLDPNYFTNSSNKGEIPARRRAVKPNLPVNLFHSRRAKAKKRLPVKTGAKAQKITNFISGKKEYFKGSFAEIARIEKSGQHVLLTINPDAAPSNLPTLKASGIIHIDEYNQFLLERLLVKNWNAGQPVVIELPIDQLFSKFPSDYFNTPRIAVVMIVPKDIYVTCGPEIPSEDTDKDNLHPAEFPISMQEDKVAFFSGNQKWQ